jgi:hypothetical protein
VSGAQQKDAAALSAENEVLRAAVLLAVAASREMLKPSAGASAERRLGDITGRLVELQRHLERAVGAPTIQDRLMVGQQMIGSAAKLLLTSDEIAALCRFDECTSDGEGYDVSPEAMQRLAEIGVVQRRPGPYYQMTEIGIAAVGHHIRNPTLTTSCSAVNEIPSMARWDDRGVVVSNSSKGDDLVLRKDVLAAVDEANAVRAVKAIPSAAWWHHDGYVVFNNQSGDDLVLRKDILAALSRLGHNPPPSDADQ